MEMQPQPSQKVDPPCTICIVVVEAYDARRAALALQVQRPKSKGDHADKEEKHSTPEPCVAPWRVRERPIIAIKPP